MIKLILTGLVAVAIAMSLTSCTPQKKMAQQYPEMYNEKPLTIALMPPINQTSNVEAKDAHRKGTQYAVGIGTRSIKVTFDGKVLYEKKLFLSSQEVKKIMLP